MARRKLAALGCALLAAGCLEFGDAPDASVPASSDDTGAIEGFVVDDSRFPIEGAELAISNLGVSTRTDVSGRYTFSKLPPGQLMVAAAKAGYEGTARKIEVVPGTVMPLNFTLVAMAAAVPYSVTHMQSGVQGCGVEAVGQSYAICQMTSAYATLFEEKSVLRWQLGDLTFNVGFWLETRWSSSNGIGTQMRVRWGYEPASPGKPYFAELRGPSPLRSPVAPETLAPTDNRGLDCHGKGCLGVSLHSPWHDVTAPQIGGVGLGISQRFDDYLTIFYYDNFPTDFTRVP